MQDSVGERGRTNQQSHSATNIVNYTIDWYGKRDLVCNGGTNVMGVTSFVFKSQ